MPVEVLMPALSPTMTEGTLSKWHKKEGDSVAPGDTLAEIETDKAIMEVEAVDAGRLGKILVPEGTENVKVKTPIALILEKGEDIKALEAYQTSGAKVEQGPTKEEVGIPSGPLPPAPVPSSSPLSSRILVSPLARRMAEEKSIDLARIEGSGPRGRIIRRDVEVCLEKASLPKAHHNTSSVPSASRYYDKPITSMRRIIAERLSESKQTVPHFYLTVECVLDPLMDMRLALNEHLGTKITVNDFVVKAAALALKDVPDANASWMGKGIRYYTTSDVSVAVALEDGLITPIVKDADTKSLAFLSAEIKTLVQKAKDGKLRPEEFQGGSFSISNLGMFGIKEFSAIINPPQACILAVGAADQRPFVKNGQLSVATVMTCTLSADHRVVDGRVGSLLLQRFKKYMETPALLLAEKA